MPSRPDLWVKTDAMRRINRRARLHLLHDHHGRHMIAWLAVRCVAVMFSWGIE